MTVGRCIRLASLSLNLSKELPCSETNSDRRLRRLSAFIPSASHTRSNDSELVIPLAKTQDDASLKDLRLPRFDESVLPRRFMASASIASIRRCTLENGCAPTDSKNWLGRSTSGSGFSRPLSKAAFLESFCIANLDLVVFRHMAVDTPAPSVSFCPATIQT
jgi:hypothetical protein